MAKLSQRKRKNSAFAGLFFGFLLLLGCEQNTPVNYITFKCSENILGVNRIYPVYFYKTKSDSTSYLISNFHNYSQEGNYDIKATIKNNTISIIPSQTLDNTRIKSGSGTVDADFKLIVLDYIIYNGVNDIPVHAEYSR